MKTTVRSASRTNLFVVATLYGGARHEPVRLRDLSPIGALLEGTGLPATGTEVWLRRAHLEAHGRIVWNRGRRAGMQFSSTIVVPDWLPAGAARDPQQRVDQIVQQVKNGWRPIASVKLSRKAPLLPVPMADEVRELIESIQSLSDDLATDPAILKRHIMKLQTLDLAAQFLARLLPDSSQLDRP